MDIPYDIWHAITTFLPSHEVKRLYSLNHSLYNIAMDERYRTVLIGSFSDERTKWNIKRLVYPEISSRVREFVFNPGHLCKLLLESASTHSEQTLEDPVSHLVDAFQSMKIKPTPSEQFSLHDVLPLPAHWAQRDALKILKQLTSLTSFRVEIRASEHWYFQRLSIAPAFFSAGWSAFSSTLTSLELRVPLEGMSTVLPPMGSFPLKNLENLSFRIIRASLSTNTSTTTIDTLLPMINHHAASLRALNIDVEERIDPSSFLRSITHLTRLQSFALVLPFSFHNDCALSSFKQLLQVHRNHLTDVSLRIIPTFDQHPISYSFFNLDPFGVALPKLRHISIDIHGFPSHFSRGLIPSIHKFTATLFSLEISEHRWSFEQLTSLLEGFSTDSRLRDLKIFLHFLEPDVFKVLADKLPRLDTLKIDFECLGPVALTNWLHNTIPRFAEEITPMNFSQWDLRKLDLSPIDLETVFRLKCKSILINAFPRVESFCGVDPMEYLLHP